MTMRSLLPSRGLESAPEVRLLTKISSSRNTPVGHAALSYGDAHSGLAMNLHVGQQVVCINDVFSPCKYWRSRVSAFPVLHGIYTIRNIREAHGLIGLCFYEIRSAYGHFAEGYVEPAFNSRNFRPVKRTSIAIFK